MKQFSAYAVAAVICIILLFLLVNPTIVSVLTGIIASIIVLIVDKVASQIHHIKSWWIALRYWNTYIRLSISYLFCIKIDDEYLLIRSERFNQYQPVGGVYKRFDSSTTFFKNIEVLDDNLVPIDEVSKHDLRIRVKGRHLISFLNWFYSGKDRELSPWREFYEELVKSGYFPHDVFPYIFYRHVKHYKHPLRYSDFGQSPELLIADIFEILPNQAQIKFLEQLHNSPHGIEKLIWAKEDKIRRRGTVPGETSMLEISLHSSWIL